MINNLQANKWSVVSAIAAVFALLVPFLLYIISHESKDLSVATVSRAVLVNLPQGEDQSVKLTYNGTPVSHLTAITIEVRNDGTRPIERSDFERPLLIRFPKSSSILAAAPGEKEPQDLNPAITLESGAITIAPLLLNPGDNFRITAQLLGEVDEPDVEARISGVRTISRQVFRDSTTESWWFLVTMGSLGMLGFYYVGSSVLVSVRCKSRVVLWPIADGVIVSIILYASAQMGLILIFDGVHSRFLYKVMLFFVFGCIGGVFGALLTWFRARAALATLLSSPPMK